MLNILIVLGFIDFWVFRYYSVDGMWLPLEVIRIFDVNLRWRWSDFDFWRANSNNSRIFWYIFHTYACHVGICVIGSIVHVFLCSDTAGNVVDKGLQTA